MKRLQHIIMLAAASIGLSAQSIDNLHLFNTTDLYGSPRYVAMGGAFSALGNDMSSLHLNPAAGSVYRKDNFAFSLGFQNRQDQTNFLGNQQQFNDFNMMLGNIGLVMKFGPRDKFYFGASYQQVANFDNFYSPTGNNISNTTNGIETGVTLGKYWLDAANPRYRTDPFALGFTANELASAGLLEEASSLGTVLLTDTNGFAAIYDYWEDGASSLHYQVEENGGRNEFVLNLGGNFEDKFYYGVGLGFTNINYRRSYTLSETGYADTSYVAESALNRTNRLDAAGMNLKIGFIYRPLQMLRIGASVETPTWWFRANEFQSVSVDAFAFDGTSFLGTEYVADDIAYSVQSPTIVRAGAAVVLGKHAIISADYEYQNTKSLTLSERDGFDYSLFQQEWQDATQDRHSLKAGAEFRLGAVYLRGGYQYTTTMYKDMNPLEGDRQVLSAGIGYKSGPVGVDLAYSLAMYKRNTYVHPSLAYAYDLNNNQQLENYIPERGLLPTDIRRGTLLLGMNFSF